MKFFAVIMLLITLSNSFAIEVIQRCYRCHKNNGRSSVNEIPVLTGQNKDYLRNQIINFQTGQRRDTYLRRMNDIVRNLTGEEIEEIVEHYGSFDPVKTFPSHRPLRGKEIELYERGKEMSNMCLTCHGSAEVRPAQRSDWPYISGQNYEAIWMQLSAFATGRRKNPMMDFIQNPPFNNPETLKALALYFSRQLPPSPL